MFSETNEKMKSCKIRMSKSTSESSSNRDIFDHIFNCQESWNCENWKLELVNIFSLVVSWKGVKLLILPALESCGWVHWDYYVSSAPFVSELSLREWNLKFWAKMSRSRAWQYCPYICLSIIESSSKVIKSSFNKVWTNKLVNTYISNLLGDKCQNIQNSRTRRLCFFSQSLKTKYD